jgi:hypothetical protein
MDKVMEDLFEGAKKEGKVPEDVTGFNSQASKWGYVETPKGIYLLDYEACGPSCSETCLTEDGNKVEFPIYFKYEGKMAIFPSASVEMGAKDVREFPTLGTENFGKFVRKFGDRLESNFHNWNRFLENEMKSNEDVQAVQEEA